MRKLINNPKFVLGLVGLAIVFYGQRYLPPDWKKRWESWVMGEALKMEITEDLAPGMDKEVSQERLLAFRPTGVPADWKNQVTAMELSRFLFPQVVDPEENRRLVLQQRIPVLPQGLRLDGIYMDGNRRVAMLSGINLGEGDYFQNARVIRIEETGVVFQVGSAEKKLELGETVPMLPKPAGGGVPGTNPVAETDPTQAALKAEEERLRKLQELGNLPAKLLQGSEQLLPQILPSLPTKK